MTSVRMSLLIPRIRDCKETRMKGSDDRSGTEDVRFSSVIDEEDIERIHRESEMEPWLLPPFMRQTYNQLILTYVIGILIQCTVYFSVPFIFGVEEPFLSVSGGEGLRTRR